MTAVSPNAADQLAVEIIQQMETLLCEEEMAWALHRYESDREAYLKRPTASETDRVWTVQSPRAVAETELRAHWTLPA